MEENNIERLFSKYNKALEILQERFNKLNTEYLKLGEANPIEHIKFRIKSESSIRKKLQKKGLEYTAENIEQNLNDVIGMRIVCSFLSDLESLITYVKNVPDFEVLNTKDYVHNPKDSGYSSYHVIIALKVPIDGKLETVNAEIQLRTMAMDVWASLDHKIRYKKDVSLSDSDKLSLQTIKDFINLIDHALDNVNRTRETSLIPRPNSTPILGTSYDFHMLFNKYVIALDKIESKLNVLKASYIANNLVNPIEHIKSRIKQIDSMANKLESKGQKLSVENVEQYITDIGAIKVVCSFASDAQTIIDVINNQTDFTIIDRQDYITNPKENGYSSYHFVVLVPVTINDQTTEVKIEIQVRTIIMELWANLEHKLCYKKCVSEQTKLELKRIAEILRAVDPEIDKINSGLYAQSQTYFPKK